MTSSMMVSANTVIVERLHPQFINPRLAELHQNRVNKQVMHNISRITMPLSAQSVTREL